MEQGLGVLDARRKSASVFIVLGVIVMGGAGLSR